MATYYTLTNGSIEALGNPLTGATTNDITQISDVNLTPNNLYTTYAISNGNPLSAIALQIANINSNPVGNLVFDVYISGSITTFTYPISSIPNAMNNIPEWCVFHLSSPLTGNAGDLISIKMRTTTSGQLSTYSRVRTNLDSTGVFSTITETNITYQTVSAPASNPDTNFFECYNFNGTSSQITTTAVLLSSTDDFTIDLWIYPRAWRGYLIGTSCANTNATSPGYAFELIANRFTFKKWGSGPTYSPDYSLSTPVSSLPTLSTWYHLAATRTNNILRLYINGTQSASASATGNFPEYLTGTNNLILGNIRYYRSEEFSWYDGLIYQPRMIRKISLSNTNTFPVSYFSHPNPLYANTNNMEFLLRHRHMFNRSLLYANNTNIPTSADNIYIGNVLSYDGSNLPVKYAISNSHLIDSIYINKTGTLEFPNNLNNSLTAIGSIGIKINKQGTMSVGTSSNPVPDNITQQIFLSSTSINVENEGTLNVYGAYKLPSTKLLTPSVAGATSFITTDPVSSTWKVNDTLIFTPNTAQPSSYDEEIIGSFSNSNTFVATTPTNFNHSVLDYVPNIANLTRNVKIGGLSNSSRGTIIAKAGSNVSINNTEFKLLDNNLADNTDNTGSFTVSGCTLSGTGSEIFILNPDSFTTSFAGAASYILAPNNSLYQISLSSTFTLEVFCNFSDTGTQRRIATIYDGTGANNGAYSWIFDRTVANTINFAQHVGTTSHALNSTTIIQPNTWYHVAVVGFGGIVYLYINGILENSTTMRNCNFSSAWRLNIGRDASFIGRLSNFRYVNGAALYTKNFSVPNTKLTSLSGTGISTLLLTCQDNPVRDNSAYNYTLTSFNLNYKFDSPTSINCVNRILDKNVLYKTRFGLHFNNPNINNSNFSNNLILSSRFAGVYITNLSGNAIINNNIAIGPSPYGTLVEYNTNNTPITGSIINYNNTYGTLVDDGNIGVISNITNTYNTSAGVYVDASTSNLSATTFSNITASNGRTLGFVVSGNSINPLTPITLNINSLVANDNLSGGFEGYSITGNLTGLELNRNGFYGMKTSIGNGPTIIDGITALMNNVNTASAGIGILSATNYHATVIKNANVGKGVGSSTFGAGIILDSTKLSQFSVYNSTVSGGSSDFRLLTTRNILEGSYLISNTNVGVLPVGVGISRNNYQSNVFRTAGFAFTNMNNASGYNVTYLAAGTRAIDSTVNITAGTAPSERLTPQSTTIKLRSGSKFVALNSGESTSISVYVRKSTVASNGVAYNGTAPRLILKRNAAIGINSDIVMDQLDTTSENFLKLSGVTPAVNDNGVLEFYIDCDGTQGFINIDNWTAN